uniref:Dynamitin n=1 Tax=Platynereis dumerilii TaxID=6359 RepID=A0A2H5BFB9_PLADU|nr:dynamitin [Platynereis dumerilii]
MADPKYASLPGIDLNSPDLYETNDLPEDDQAQVDQSDQGNENVEKINVSATDAYKKFEGKTLEGGKVDFSDRVSGSRRIGYDAPQTEYEMQAVEREPETPQQKYQRLQHEIRELQEEVSKAKENVKADAETEKVSPVPLVKQAEYLQQQLTDLHLDKLLGDQAEVNLADPQRALHKRLLTELDSYKPTEAQAKSEKDAPSGNQVTYQLYYRPEQAKFTSNARAANIEQRLERMEALIGNNPEKLSMLTAETSNKSIVGAVGVLSSKVKLLDATQLEQVEGRLHALSQRLTKVVENKETAEEADKTAKVSELFEMVKKWDAVVDTLPHVVDRLTALKELHEQALQFSQALNHLDAAQQQVSSHMNAHSDMLKQVQTTLTENLSTLKDNCASIDDRVKALK